MERNTGVEKKEEMKETLREKDTGKKKKRNVTEEQRTEPSTNRL